MSTLQSVIVRDVIASRPSAGVAGRLFISTDTGVVSRDNGATWDNITIDAGQITGLAASATTDTTDAANISSGTLPAARLPNPSAATLGGVQSIASVTHNFLTSISTSGVPSLAQPTEADLSLSDITTNNVSISKHGLAPKAPNDATKFLDGTGAYSVPTGASAVLTTKGDLLGYDTGVNRIPVGSNGQVLTADSAQTLGLKWAPAAGTVSSVALTVPSWLSVSGSPVTSSGTLAVTATTGETANQFLATPNGSTGAVALRAIVQADLPAQPVDIPCSFVGKPDAAGLVLIFTATRAITFPGNFSGAYGTLSANPTATAAYTVNKNGSSIGSVSISTSGVFTFTTSSGTSQSLAAGDRLTVTAPSPQDATLSDVGFTLSATR